MTSNTRKSGSLAAYEYNARSERQSRLFKALDEPAPDVARVAAATASALRSATEIAKLSRASDEIPAHTFVTQFLGLDTFVNWLSTTNDVKSVMEVWPSDPGCTFALKGGSSALHVARIFAESIRDACVVARALHRVPAGDSFWDEQTVSPEAADAIVQWTRLARDELLRHVIPFDHIWPVMGHVHRDYASLTHKLNHEYVVARERALQQPVNIKGIAARLRDHIDRYAAYREGLFHELITFINLDGGWRIEYKRDPAVDGDVTLPPRITHRTGTITLLGESEFEGVATFQHAET